MVKTPIPASELPRSDIYYHHLAGIILSCNTAIPDGYRLEAGVSCLVYRLSGYAKAIEFEQFNKWIIL
ncbi:MAG: hypothetical protein R6U04_02800 [Bacteroidales bacterium]